MSTIAIAPDGAARASAPTTSASANVFGPRLLMGLGGILLASLIAGLNEHVSEIGLADIRGAMGISRDQGRWLLACYEAAQVAAMAFAPWCAVTFSLRRFAMVAVAAFCVLGLLGPWAPDIASLYLLRALQGLAGGCLPPLLMSVALRFLPPGIKLYGLAAYALTATFGPNLGTPLAALWSEYVGWHWLFWQIVPPGLLAIAAIAYGLPQDPLRLERFAQFNARGLALGLPAIVMLVLGLEQGAWLGWFDSPLICLLLGGGTLALLLLLRNEWSQPLPFFKLQLLARRNLSHALITLAGVLVLLVLIPGVPAGQLARLHDYRPLQSAPLALLVALPQLLALPLVAALCNLRWVDCRWVLAMGLALLACSCLLGSQLGVAWTRQDFYPIQCLQIMAQPMAVIPLLMLATNGLSPLDGPFASAWFNTIKGFAAVLGTAVLEGVAQWREHVHASHLLDRLGEAAGREWPSNRSLSAIAAALRSQVETLAAADVYRVGGLLALALMLLIPLLPTRVYPPRAAPSN